MTAASLCTRFLAVALLGLILTACSGGGGGGGAGGNGNGGGGNPGGSTFGGIQAASDGSRGANVANVLAVGDRFEFAASQTDAQQIADQVWQILRTPQVWTGSNPLYTYQFYEDPSFLPGPLFRYTGFEVEVGQIVLNSAGTYTAADGRGPFLAVGLRTWDYQPEFLIVDAASQQMVHAIQHTNGFPIETTYRAQ